MTRRLYLDSTAAYSSCRRYRYSLTRRVSMGERAVLFVGLNPSTATAVKDDPTIRRCVGYTRDWGFDLYLMGNIMAFRSTDPKGLPVDSMAAVGPGNREALIALAARAELIVCAWGANRLGPAATEIAAMIMAFPHARCLGANKDGTPKHPLYLKRSLVPVALPLSRSSRLDSRARPAQSSEHLRSALRARRIRNTL